MPKKSFTDQVSTNEAAVTKRTSNAVKDFSTKERARKSLKRTCVLVEPQTWDEFKSLCSDRYGITASAQINLFINNFILNEKRKMREENE